jgi:thioredoxin reductase
VFDVIVIGGGPAGLSAALVLGRQRRRVLVADGGEVRNAPADEMHMYLSRDGFSPHELLSLGRAELAAYPGVEVRAEQVASVSGDIDDFTVDFADGSRERARRLILATGQVDEPYDIPGVPERFGRSIFHCPFCHGWEVRDRTVVVHGRGEAAERLAAMIAGWTDDVTVVDPDEVAGLRSDSGSVRAVVRHDGSEVPCDAVLVHAPLRPRGVLPERLGLELTDDGLVAIDAAAHTSVPGVYAAGDVAVAPQQVAIAMGSGHLAGVVAVREILLAAQSATPSSS